jgi:hypothetical protein
MGITGLWNLFGGYVMGISVAHAELELGGCMGVDLSHVWHKMIRDCVTSRETIVEVPATADAEGRLVPSSTTSVVTVFVNEPLLLETCVAYITGERRGDCGVIVVFDGIDPPAKAEHTRADRDAVADKARTSFEAAKDLMDKIKHYKKFARPSPQFFAAVKTRLDSLSLSWIQACFEADAVLVDLHRRGITTWTLADDGDLFAQGVRLMDPGRARCIDIGRPPRTEESPDSAFCASLIKRGLVVMYACVLGCDYSGGIAGYGRAKIEAVFMEDANLGWSSKTEVCEVVASFRLKGEAQVAALASVQKAHDVFTHGWASRVITTTLSRGTVVPIRLTRIAEDSTAGARISLATGRRGSGTASACSPGYLRNTIPAFDARSVPPLTLLLNENAARAYLIANGIPEDDLQPMTKVEVTAAVRSHQADGYFPSKFVPTTEANAEADRRVAACAFVGGSPVFVSPTEVAEADAASSLPSFSYQEVEAYLAHECRDPSQPRGGPDRGGAPRSAVLGAAIYQSGGIDRTQVQSDPATGHLLVHMVVRSSCHFDDSERAKTSYNVSLKLKTVGMAVGGVGVDHIVERYCQCLPGAATCKHIAAVLYRLVKFLELCHQKIDSTMRAKQWGDGCKDSSLSHMAEVAKVKAKTTPPFFRAALDITASYLRRNGPQVSRAEFEKRAAIYRADKKEENKKRPGSELGGATDTKRRLCIAKEIK